MVEYFLQDHIDPTKTLSLLLPNQFTSSKTNIVFNQMQLWLQVKISSQLKLIRLLMTLERFVLLLLIQAAQWHGVGVVRRIGVTLRTDDCIQHWLLTSLWHPVKPLLDFIIGRVLVETWSQLACEFSLSSLFLYYILHTISLGFPAETTYTVVSIGSLFAQYSPPWPLCLIP